MKATAILERSPRERRLSHRETRTSGWWRLSRVDGRTSSPCAKGRTEHVASHIGQRWKPAVAVELCPLGDQRQRQRATDCAAPQGTTLRLPGEPVAERPVQQNVHDDIDELDRRSDEGNPLNAGPMGMVLQVAPRNDHGADREHPRREACAGPEPRRTRKGSQETRIRLTKEARKARQAPRDPTRGVHPETGFAGRIGSDRGCLWAATGGEDSWAMRTAAVRFARRTRRETALP